MPPERHESPAPILAESRRIADKLLEVQGIVNTAHATLQQELLADVREQLQYPQPEDVDTARLVDTRITQKEAVISPEALDAVLPLTQRSADTTLDSRDKIEQIVRGDDDRLVVIMGPCSIHDPEAAMEYAKFALEMREQYGEDLEIIMRFYSEKPRTELGWKGLVADPLMDGSDDMNLGLVVDRMISVRITDMGVPLARERLNANTPQYSNGLFAYDSIGARNVTDQKAREYASGTSSVIGIKNGTDGTVGDAISAIVSANGEHTLLGLAQNGQQAVVHTAGNPTTHIILRGGSNGPNFDAESVNEAVQEIKAANERTGLSIPEGVVIDASHKNKVNGEQMTAVESVAGQITAGSVAIRGVMIESNLKSGNQDLKKLGPDNLEYGKSITDSCVDLAETRIMLEMLSQAIRTRRLARAEHS